jgi:ribosomal protein L11 methyltransferase
MNLESLDLDLVEAVLLENGAQSVTLSDAADDPVLEPAPGETPLWADTRVTALFDSATDLDTLTSKLLEALGRKELPPNHIEELADRAWEREWLKDFGPLQFGRRLWVIPGDSDPPAGDAVVVRLDPGLAFGTGTHATTALCLEWLDRMELTDRTLFDFGCGSGILSVAALKLGASFVEATDIDLQAVTATRQNAQRNRVATHLRVDTDISSQAQQFDLVVANILADTLIENVLWICDRLKPAGKLALSGILESQVDEVQDAYCNRIDFETPTIRDEWALLSGIRN